jgi:prolyl-tRNA synthetase
VKLAVPIDELPEKLTRMLDEFQARLFERALRMRDSYTVEVASREDLLAAYSDGRQALARGPWCGDEACEADIKEAAHGVTIRAIVDDSASGACAGCGRPAHHTVYWARAY